MGPSRSARSLLLNLRFKVRASDVVDQRLRHCLGTVSGGMLAPSQADSPSVQRWKGAEMLEIMGRKHATSRHTVSRKQA